MMYTTSPQQMTNKNLIISFGIAILFTLLGYILNSFKPEEHPADTLILVMSSIASLFGLSIIYRTSTIQRTKYFRIIQMSFSIVIIGIVFRLQHWWRGEIIILIGVAALIVTYSFRFASKKSKIVTDVLKWLLVVSGAFAFAFNLEHWKYNYALTILFKLTMLLTILSVSILMLKTEFKKEQ